jgi:salicylate hydroxylase
MTVKTAPRVAVIGAGIGGLTFAVAAHREGIPVTVYEQAKQLHPIGAGLQLGPNIVRLLSGLGLGERLGTHAVFPEAIEFRHWASGETLLRAPVRERYLKRFGRPHCLVHRADLHGLLVDAMVDGDIRTAHRCVAVDEDVNGVVITFENGHSAEADIVVGADGVHSVVRDSLFGREAAAFSGTCAYRGLVPTGALPFLPPEAVIRMWPGPGRQFLCYPVSSSRLMNFVAVVPSRRWMLESWYTPASITEAIAAFADWDPFVSDIMSGAEKIYRWALYDRNPLPSWATRRICLLGDAAHPMLPHQAQGASQAIEDAITLAILLSHVDRFGIAELLRRYVEVRSPRTARIQSGSRSNGKAFQGSGSVESSESAVFGHVLDDMTRIFEHDAAAVAQKALLSLSTSPMGGVRLCRSGT